VHDVHLRAEQGRLLIACSCPALSLGIDLCKHAWAALLEVDRQDALSDLRSSRGPLVVEPTPAAPRQDEARHQGDEPALETPARRAPSAASEVDEAPRKRSTTPSSAKAPRAPTSSTKDAATRPKDIAKAGAAARPSRPEKTGKSTEDRRATKKPATKASAKSAERAPAKDRKRPAKRR